MRCTTRSSSDPDPVGNRRHIDICGYGRLSSADSARCAFEVDSMVERNPLRILLVEDSAVLADRLTELLHYIPGVQLVDTVDNELAAVRIALSQPIDVMILDLHLRQGTGFGVLRALAHQPRAT